VFAEAARLGKALEIDCYPDRQDLGIHLLKVAREHGVLISLGADAHHPWQLEFIELGLAAALQGETSCTTNRQFHAHAGFKTLDTTAARSQRAEIVSPFF
jgi:hypothetical protein